MAKSIDEIQKQQIYNKWQIRNLNVMRRERLKGKCCKIPQCKDDYLVVKGTTPIFNNIDIALVDKWWMCGLEYGLLATLSEKWSE